MIEKTDSKTAPAPKTMAVMCHKCQAPLGIDPRLWYMLGDLDCPTCGEESYQNWILDGYSNKKPPHDIKLLVAECDRLHEEDDE